MAKPKQATLIRAYTSNRITVWTNEVSRVIEEISEVEGINLVVSGNGSAIFLYTDPRYDVDEIADEIRLLLSSEVPSVFRE